MNIITGLLNIVTTAAYLYLSLQKFIKAKSPAPGCTRINLLSSYKRLFSIIKKEIVNELAIAGRSVVYE
ncbi:MAG: hypothetical protein IPL50_15070 [Chitinophagaceae bacterium]|nr:hypothetical protein [Chitinophagaceae bacterium]